MRLRNLGFDVFVFLPVSAKGLNSGQKRWREWCGQASANSGVGNDVISGKIAIFVYRNEIIDMKAYTYIEKGKFALVDKPKPAILEPTDAIVRVTLGSICTSDLHIKHGSVPRAVPGITVGHEMVGIVEEIGSEVKGVSVGDRVTVNVETFCLQ